MLKRLLQGLGLLKDYEHASAGLGKRWYLSRTLWVNVIAYAALCTQDVVELTLDEQGAVLVLVNLAMRAVTKKPLIFVPPPSDEGEKK